MSRIKIVNKQTLFEIEGELRGKISSYVVIKIDGTEVENSFLKSDWDVVTIIAEPTGLGAVVDTGYHRYVRTEESPKFPWKSSNLQGTWAWSDFATNDILILSEGVE